MPVLKPSPITHLLFDLDGTLYPKENGIWAEISARMERYMAEVLAIPPADIPGLRQRFFLEYGTTLRGLQHNYKLDSEAYLAWVHDIDLARFLQPDPELRRILLALPQPKYIFTNSDRNHTQRVLAALKIQDLFSGIFDVWEMQYNNKPHPEVYRQVVDFVGAASPTGCMFVEDTLQNLIPARELGMATVLVGTAPNSAADYIISSIHELPNLPPLR